MDNQNKSLNPEETVRLVLASAQKRAPVMARWLWVPFVLSFVFLFTLFFGIVFLSFLEDTLKTVVRFPGGYALYGLVLLRLAVVEKRFLPAGLCTLGAAAVLTIFLFFSGRISRGLFFGLLYFGLFLSAAGIYLRCVAMENALSGVDVELNQKWHRIRLWRPICIAVAPLFFYLADLFHRDFFGVIGFLALGINIVLLIPELILLYRTMQACGTYTRRLRTGKTNCESMRENKQAKPHQIS